MKVARCLSMEGHNHSLHRHSSGIPGLDTLLRGGFVQDRLYLGIGAPGTGKTLLGSHFLQEGLAANESVLFIHGEESEADLIANAARVNVDIADAAFLDIGPASDFFTGTYTYDVVDPRDVEIEEGHPITDIREAIKAHDPDRVVIDPISQLQYIEANEYQFRRRIIAFTRFLTGQGTTVFVTRTPGTQMDDQLRSLSDGVIRLTHETDGRRISIPKHRGIGQRDGTHGLEITETGLTVYPALHPESADGTFAATQLSSGDDQLDALLGGGLERGTVTVLSGPSGVGKSTVAAKFLHTAATTDESALAYLFEEAKETFTHREETFGVPVTRLEEEGALTVTEITPRSLSPEEFAQQVTTQINDRPVSLVVIDGIEGYRTAIKGGGEQVDLTSRLHRLVRALTNRNVTVLLIDERDEVTGVPQPTGSNVSYLADNLIFQQYLELEGELQRAIGVLKKRVSGFESTPRQFWITDDGLNVGEPLTNLHGIIEGVPDSLDSDDIDAFQ